MPMLLWPLWPLAGHARLGQNTVVGAMTILLSWLCWGACQEEVCLDPHCLCNLTLPRFSVELPFRLPRTKYPEIQREGIDKTVKEECAHIPHGYPESHQRTQTGADRGVDKHAQSQASRMGTVPPARLIKRNLEPCRPRHLPNPVAMGKAEAPTQREAMDQGPLL